MSTKIDLTSVRAGSTGMTRGHGRATSQGICTGVNHRHDRYRWVLFDGGEILTDKTGRWCPTSLDPDKMETGYDIVSLDLAPAEPAAPVVVAGVVFTDATCVEQWTPPIVANPIDTKEASANAQWLAGTAVELQADGRVSSQACKRLLVCAQQIWDLLEQMTLVKGYRDAALSKVQQLQALLDASSNNRVLASLEQLRKDLKLGQPTPDEDVLTKFCHDILTRAWKYDDKPHQLWNGLRLLALHFDDQDTADFMNELYENPPKMVPKSPPMPVTPEVLAEDFSDLLRAVLSHEQLLRVVIRNQKEKDPSICHSHDFCDPNQIMIDALQKHGIEFDVQDDAQAKLISAAWDIAKARGFAKPDDPESY